MGGRPNNREVIPGPPEIDRAVYPGRIISVQNAILVRRGDTLRISSFSSLANVNLSIVIRTLVGQDVKIGLFALATNGIRTAQTLDIDMTDGELIGVFIQATSGSTAVRGQIFVKATVIFGSIGSGATSLTNLLILSSYVTTNTGISYPTSPLLASVDGVGFLTVLSTGGVAGNANADIIIPINTRWRIIAERSSLTTDATVANRNLQISNGIAVEAVDTPITQPASIANRIYYHGDYAQSTALSLNSNVFLKLPINLYLRGGQIVRQVIFNGVAGDTQFLDVYFEEWFDL